MIELFATIIWISIGLVVYVGMVMKPEEYGKSSGWTVMWFVIFWPVFPMAAFAGYLIGRLKKGGAE